MALTGPVAGQGTRTANSEGYETLFTRVYEEHYTKVFAFVYSRVRCVELAKDLVAQTFEKAYLKGHSVRDPQAYGSWLFTVARNVIAGHFRRAGRELRGQERAREDLSISNDTTADPEEMALLGERVASLMQHVRRLPQRDQELISLKFDGELTNAEIGKIRGMSALNVRVSIFRALRKLRSAMEKEYAV